MTFHKWYGRYYFLCFNKHMSFSCDGCNMRIRRWVIAKVFPPGFNIRIKPKCCTNCNTQCYLPENFKPSCKSVLVTLFICYTLFLCNFFSPQFQIIINKPNCSQPKGTENHQPYIYFIQISK